MGLVGGGLQLKQTIDPNVPRGSVSKKTSFEGWSCFPAEVAARTCTAMVAVANVMDSVQGEKDSVHTLHDAVNQFPSNQLIHLHSTLLPVLSPCLLQTNSSER